jgi:hypothetical protein
MKLAIVLFVWAQLVLAGGVWAFASAPAGSNPATALIVSGTLYALIIALAALAFAWRLKRALLKLLGSLAILGAVAFAAMAMVQGGTVASGVGRFQDAVAKFEAARSARADAASAPSAGAADLRAHIAALNAPIVDRAVREGQLSASADEGERRRYLRANAGVPDHDQTYLRNTLFGLGGVSLLAAGGVFLAWPRAPKLAGGATGTTGTVASPSSSAASTGASSGRTQ